MIQVIKTDKGYVAVSDEEIKLPKVYPLIVLEKLTNGKWDFWQIDNPNDLDIKNQRYINLMLISTMTQNKPNIFIHKL